ncbi:helix-turn-helix domain-containing protein [Radiobacillus deserti]|uniref:Helix-turn-helix transcriptional regulator n=1 Tax=Radiobacillus deserti TaxID=2594883 RepID=A0A516KHD0_9BACI|nr:helix-turn-helix transcriptional regulator [Radiobacillus deserti]QDP40795.1 helix-turn-helix transcriptional regulator [Radiobacillus deserti]
MKFAERLKKHREEIKKERPEWTQSYVAERIGVARVTYTSYENGTKLPPLDTVDRIATLMDVSADYLIGRTDEKSPRLISDKQKEINVFAERDSVLEYYESLKEDEEFNPIYELNRLIKEYGIDQIGFLDYKKWENFTKEDIDEIRRHFEWVSQRAKERNEDGD